MTMEGMQQPLEFPLSQVRGRNSLLQNPHCNKLHSEGPLKLSQLFTEDTDSNPHALPLTLHLPLVGKHMQQAPGVSGPDTPLHPSHAPQTEHSAREQDGSRPQSAQANDVKMQEGGS
ncbi:UNVERIFIED_CONTAM: hypothetical protein K2H54_042979 [Gekko kuhli]